MDVIGVGFGRTGTASLKVALERLGFSPCCHMMEVMEQPGKVRQWRKVGEGERPDWAELFASYRATVDWPGAAYWRELAKEYPRAKLILTERDPQRWYQSCVNTIFRFPMRRHNALERNIYAMLCRANPPAARVPTMIDKILWDRVFGGRPFDGGDGDREYAIRAFVQHSEEVKAYIPAERLLVFNVADGWEPLCEFLGVPVPDEPFPRLNEADAFNKVIAARVRSGTLPVAAGGAALMAALGGVIAAAAGAGAAVSGGAAAAGAVMAITGVALSNAFIAREARKRSAKAAAGH